MDAQSLRTLINRQRTFVSSVGNLDNYISNYGCVDGEIIGTGRSDYTQNATSYDLHIDGKCFSLIDIPGIEGDESKFEKIIRTSLEKAHTIFYVNGSGKKIEKDSLAKIKKYMHDGTSVYAIFNVHCKAKKERIPGIDATFSEELSDAYRKQQEIIRQTERELISFLGTNYKGSIPLNGLLAFSSLALAEDESTTIVEDANKSLRNDQRKYLKEYDNQKQHMLSDSNVERLHSIIEQKVHSFDSDIYNENIKKLRNRLTEMIQTIEKLSRIETEKLNGFIRTYSDFKINCCSARDDFIFTIRHLASNVVGYVFSDVQDDLFRMVEEKEGKLKDSNVEFYFESNKKRIVDEIQRGVNERIKQAVCVYEEGIQEARNRLQKDMEREQISFEASLSDSNLSVNQVLGNSLKYTMKDFGKHAFTTGGLVITGALLGSTILPVLGTIIGGAIGLILGILSSVVNFFLSKQTRIAKAEEKIRSAINDIESKISAELKDEIEKLHCTDTINANCEELLEIADKQIESLDTVKKLLRSVHNELKQKKQVLV